MSGMILLHKEQLLNLMTDCMEMARISTRIEYGDEELFISQNKAIKLGCTRTELCRWASQGIITRHKDIGKGRTSRVRYNKIEILKAINSNNLYNKISPKAEAEIKQYKNL